MACSYNMKLVTSLYYKKIHIFTLLSMLDDKILVFHDDDWCKSYIAFKIDEFSYKCVNNSIYKKFNRISSFTKPHRRLMEWNEWTYKNVRMSINNATVISINANICFITLIKKTLPKFYCCWRDIIVAPSWWCWIFWHQTLTRTTRGCKTGHGRWHRSYFLSILERLKTILAHASHRFMLLCCINEYKIMSFVTWFLVEYFIIKKAC